MSALKKNIEARHELPIGQQVIDVRPLGDKFSEWLSVPINLFLVAIPVAIFTMAVPVTGLITFPFLFAITIAHMVNKEVLPIRYPMDGLDEKGKSGDGIMYIGSIASDSPFEKFKEIWLADDDLRKHMLILGSTGSGKSEALKSIFYNALNWSSGFFIADGKADNKLPTDVSVMVRSIGRDPDLLFLNFLLAGKTPEQVRRSRRRRTNKLNPFSSADADTIIQMGSNLLPKVEGDGKNWQEKALNLWRSAVAALCYKRDTAGFELSIATFIDYMSLPKIEELYLEGYQEAMTRGGDWSYGFAGIKNYLESGCPAYQTNKLLKKHGFLDEQPDHKPAFGGGGRGPKSGKEFEQDTMAYEQHSYRTNQLMPVLNLLDKTYGFIFRDKYPEIDMSDVTLRNRILVMLIPSLEKSAAEAENLGKLAIACLRVMMSKNLGAELEGNYEELLGSKATHSPYPYIVALDELAYYFSDGIAVMFAQARSLGVCMIAAAQDLEKLTEGSRASEAGAMLANQVTKFFMRIDDTGKTAEMIQKVVGKATVAVRRTFKFNDMGYARRNDVDVIEADRVSTQKLQKFDKGEGIVNALGVTSFMRWFYMGEDIMRHQTPNYMVNRFLQVASPTKEEIIANSIAIDEMNDPYRKGQDLLKKLNQEDLVEMHPPFDSVLSSIGDYAKTISDHVPSENRGILLYLEAERALLEDEQNSVSGSGSTGGRGNSHKPALQNLQKVNDQDGSLGENGQGNDADEHQSLVAPDLNSDGEETTDHDVLSFLNDSTPFERKPSVDVLGINIPKSVTVIDAVTALSSDPFAVMVDQAQTMSFSDNIVFRGKVLSQIIGAPSVVDETTGLPVEAKDDWIGDALAESQRMIGEKRSSDDTVIGLSDLTIGNVEALEVLLKSPSPIEAAKSLERVIAAKVTPNTIATQPIDLEEVDVFFGMLEDRLNQP